MTYLSTFDLSAECLRKFVNILDNSRILVRSSLLLYVVLKFLCKLRRRRIALCKNYCCLYDLSAYRIRSTCDSRFNYRRMSEQCALDLKRSDTITGALDNIVISADKPVIAL